MKRQFAQGELHFEVPNKYRLSVNGEGLSYRTKNGTKDVDVKFSEVKGLFLSNYCNQNQHYQVAFRNDEWKTFAEIDTDVTDRRDAAIAGNNIIETKSILIAFAESKLGEEFPNNLDALNLDVCFTFKEKGVRLEGGVLRGAKHQMNLSELKRVKCVSNGTLSYLCLYKSEKGGFFDFPDMSLGLNELTLPIIEAALARNVGRVVDFSRGNGFDQKTSEYILERYMNSTFFQNPDGSVSEDWQIAYDHIHFYGCDVRMPE